MNGVFFFILPYMTAHMKGISTFAKLAFLRSVNTLET